ncbi:MAG TPA: DEAD/DEAH box helicase [Rhizomicrobium sp.]|jgi:superfamily II DNA/RNA helicase|nr:DEAD/DEAH box helicase [Rhizomicrobium sp.]
MTTDTIAGAQAGSEDTLTVASPSDLTSPANSLAQDFDGLGLSPSILKAVAESGYTTPTPIQARGIPLVLKHRDLVGIAQTGTGKTASFTLPMIEVLSRGRAKARMPRSLILEPTRELAAQVAESFERYGKYNKLSMALLIGGVSYEDQDKKLDRGVDVLIATPGRLLDHFERGKLMLGQVQILVVDEADRMLDMGFIPDVERVCKLIPFTRQTLFYSATMPPEIKRLTEQFLHNPEQVEVSRPATTAATITQEIVEVPANDWAKRESLRRLVQENGVKNAIVFCNRKRDVDVVARSLQKHGFSAAPLHGDLDQAVRTKTLDAFRNGEVRLLVASDVAARGLDIPAVSHIFNFDVPFHPDDYVHRVGRTGRAGREGHAFMLATPRDAKLVDAIEKLTGQPISHRKMEGLEIREESKHPRSHRRSDHREGTRDRKPGAPPPQAWAKTAPAAKHEPVRPHQPAGGSKNPPAPRRDNQPRRNPEHDTPDLSHLPAFLLRPVKLPPVVEKPARKTRKAVAPA